MCNMECIDALEATHLVDLALREELEKAYEQNDNLPISVNDAPNGLHLGPLCHTYFDKEPKPFIRIKPTGSMQLFGGALKSEQHKKLNNTFVDWADNIDVKKIILPVICENLL